jgi:hypothetical protein
VAILVPPYRLFLQFTAGDREREGDDTSGGIARTYGSCHAAPGSASAQALALMAAISAEQREPVRSPHTH